MKKLIILISVFVLSMVGIIFSRDNDTTNDTMDKVDGFAQEIITLAKGNGYHAEMETPTKTSSKRSLIIDISKDQSVNVYFNNLGYKKGTGDSMFSVECIKLDDHDFNLDFFVEIVNVASKKKITKDELIEFLLADEAKYPPEKYGYKKFSDETIKKVKSNFWQTWEMSYVELNDGSVTLDFGGLTK